MISEKDIHLLKNKGITTDKIEQQLKNFISGFPYMRLYKPSTPGSGLKTFDDKAINEFVNFYLFCIPNIRNLKFVPASGAASRMFNHLFAFIEKYKDTEIKSFTGTDFEFTSVGNFIKNIRNFAFFEDLKKAMKQQEYDIDECIAKHQYVRIIDFLLNEHGLNYSALPKALIKFHNYPEGPRTALEEHLVEGAKYCYNKNKEIEIHFTISPEHILIFKERLQSVLPYYENLFHVRFLISYSVQKPSTDTIAVDENNQPFRNENGSLLFRPGGHGALIYNLNEMDADIVFIKNIDNVVPDSMKDETILYKMALAGYLLQIRDRIYEYLRILENGNLPEETIEKIAEFAKNGLSHNFHNDYFSFDDFNKITYLQNLLNRPLRVCGMVKNQGEPGGGPFVVRDSQGMHSRQIIETSQINLDDEHQKNILNQSTYFNPVDLVCCFRNYKGEKFNLHDFVDPSTGFISHKTKDGKPLKAQELPGLWNGAMAFWNTIFVEVPISTFNPVKTVNDLLRKEHIS